MVWVELWVRLKVGDLVTQTAWMTLTEKLGLADELCGLAHYTYWGMTADAPGGDAALDEIDRVVRMDSAFTNQNKHRYRLLMRESEPGAGRSGANVLSPSIVDLTSRGDLVLEKDLPLRGEGKQPAGRKRIFVFDCLVRELRPDRERGFEDRLNGLLRGMTVSRLRYGEVWRVLLFARNAGEARERLDRLMVTRTRREGLLLNPHYQRFEIVSSSEILGGDREGQA